MLIGASSNQSDTGMNPLASLWDVDRSITNLENAYWA